MNAIRHVAIVMDGNGRWAQQRLRPRMWGHVRGSNVVSAIVEYASQIKLEALTLYAFSTENWTRPQKEIATIIKIFKKFLVKERNKILDNKIQFKVIGDRANLDPSILELIDNLEEETRSFDGLKLSIAFSYGGRKEIVTAVNRFIKENPSKEISEEDISNNLYRPESGDVDLLIRTAGDQRISNFLLWSVSYAELYFSSTKWPEFNISEFQQILDNFNDRERRFGGVIIKDNSNEMVSL